jgi:hypothetical protein
MKKYGRLSNDHVRRERNLEYCVYYDDVFDSVELDNINKFMDEVQLTPAITVGEFYDGVKHGPNESPRVSNAGFISPTEDFQWIFDRFNNAISTLNDRHYGFDLHGYNHIQLTEYRGDQSGKYDWHMDTMLGDIPGDIYFTRKLSAVLLLSEPDVDFFGGKFHINRGEEKDAMEVVFKKGRMILFPSFIIHRVTPVTQGVRRSMVAWVEGPKFI